MASTEARPRLIMSKKFAEALKDAGIIEDLAPVRRIIIDCRAGQPLMIHVEYMGDERILDVVRTLDGIEVKHAGGTA